MYACAFAAVSLYACSPSARETPQHTNTGIRSRNIAELEYVLNHHDEFPQVNAEHYKQPPRDVNEEVKRMYWNLKGWLKQSLDDTIKFALGEESEEKWE